MVSQHRLVVMKLSIEKKRTGKIRPRKLKDGTVTNAFIEGVLETKASE